MKYLLLASFAAVLLGFCSIDRARSDDGDRSKRESSIASSAHGGVAASTKKHTFEAVFTDSEMKLFVLGTDRQPVDTSKLSVSATFFHPDSPKPWFKKELRPSASSRGMVPNSLELKINLSKVPATGAKVEFVVSGFSSTEEPTATFTVPFRIAKTGKIVLLKSTRADDKAIKLQKKCPISGEDLFMMGRPLKVTRDGEAIFICCQDCLKKIQADPEKYFGADKDAPKDSKPSPKSGDQLSKDPVR